MADYKMTVSSDTFTDSTRRSHEGNDELEIELFNLSSEDERKLLRKIDVQYALVVPGNR